MKLFRKILLAVVTVGYVATASAAQDEKNQWPMYPFAWGADVASSIDLTGQDLSTFNIAGALGYKNQAIQVVGAGAEINIAVGNSSRMYPVYGIIRTSFTRKPSRCFMEAKVGYGFNRMADRKSHDGVYASGAWGINLAMSKNFRSYLTVGYTYRQLSGRGYKDLSAVTTGIGISF